MVATKTNKQYSAINPNGSPKDTMVLQLATWAWNTVEFNFWKDCSIQASYARRSTSISTIKYRSTRVLMEVTKASYSMERLLIITSMYSESKMEHPIKTKELKAPWSKEDIQRSMWIRWRCYEAQFSVVELESESKKQSRYGFSPKPTTWNRTPPLV